MTKVMADFLNFANAAVTVKFMNLSIYQYCVGTACNYCLHLHLHFLQSLVLSSAVFSKQMNNQLHTAAFFRIPEVPF
jgi:hypothetical protein